jgi:hypothetical protein
MLSQKTWYTGIYRLDGHTESKSDIHKAFHRIATVPLFNVVAAIAALFGVRK